MHHWFSQSLQLQLLCRAELLYQSLKNRFIDEGGRTVGRPILAELDGAHATTKIALAHRLDLHEARKRRPVIGFWRRPVIS
jgi:hypothetical protein